MFKDKYFSADILLIHLSNNGHVVCLYSEEDKQQKTSPPSAETIKPQQSLTHTTKTDDLEKLKAGFIQLRNALKTTQH